ncbi:MAG TPA: glycine cleavage T C-terminal barrel domain-containing protein [Vicinamibacterales bacterium]|nr:glycine cleavage T C-terminal barrel domain-containing protein [Vicinamibacterales bacterium]
MAGHDVSDYDAARTGAAVLDRGARGKLVVAGADRRSYLQAMLTNDVAALAPGTGCYSAYLTPQGRMICDMRVLELGDLILMDLDRQRAGQVLQKLDQFVFSEDVQLGDVSETFGLISIVGPGAPALLAPRLDAPPGQGATTITAEELAAWSEFRNARVTLAGEPAIVVASGELGVRGVDVFLPAAAAGGLLEGLVRGGAVPLTSPTAEVLRIEAGRPAFGVDMDTETIPLEAGIEGRAISFTKGCYPGQEIVIRVVHRGHGRLARRLAGLRIDASEAPSPGDRVAAGDRDAGRITSACLSPAVGGPIAIAMVHRDFLEPGTALTVRHGDQPLPATIVALPFVAPG